MNESKNIINVSLENQDAYISMHMFVDQLREDKKKSVRNVKKKNILKSVKKLNGCF